MPQKLVIRSHARKWERRSNALKNVKRMEAEMLRLIHLSHAQHGSSPIPKYGFAGSLRDLLER
jgi:hypothetical protein